MRCQPVHAGSSSLVKSSTRASTLPSSSAISEAIGSMRSQLSRQRRVRGLGRLDVAGPHRVGEDLGVADQLVDLALDVARVSGNGLDEQGILGAGVRVGGVGNRRARPARRTRSTRRTGGRPDALAEAVPSPISRTASPSSSSPHAASTSTQAATAATTRRSRVGRMNRVRCIRVVYHT